MKRINPNELELSERIVYINRVAKVVKGGRRFSFSVIVAVGDAKGHIGVGLGKAREVPEAIRKAGESARKGIFLVQINKGTFPHDIEGRYGAAKVLLKSASDGTGIIAGGACRSILELAGIKNALTKAFGTTNPHNLMRATVNGLRNLRTEEEIMQERQYREMGKE